MIGLKINRRIWLKLSSDTKYKCKLNTSRSVYFFFFSYRCCFAGSFQFSLLMEKYTKLFQSNFRVVLKVSTRKTLLYRILSFECLRSHSQSDHAVSCKLGRISASKGPNFGAKLTHLCLPLIGRIIFLTREKHFSRL